MKDKLETVKDIPLNEIQMPTDEIEDDSTDVTEVTNNGTNIHKRIQHIAVWGDEKILGKAIKRRKRNK